MTLKNPSSTVIPKLIYGTAWKKGRTAEYVYQALKTGFRAVDTAAQPRHYQENLVGDGIRQAIKEGLLARGDIYIQTKFTPLTGQDHNNMPYSIFQSLEERIHTSIVSSFENLQTSNNPDDNYIDCLVLHSPLPEIEDTITAWETMSAYVPHKIRALGISNTTYEVLQTLHERMEVKPSVVQNRFYPATQWEVPLRKFCREQGIIFQSFWTLTGNPNLIRSDPIVHLAGELKSLGVWDPGAMALYTLVLGLDGITVLNGTTQSIRMRRDIEGLEAVSKWADGVGREKWLEALKEFKELIGEEA
ncbi:hypothetical protein OIDMADRAFT_127177 [Oidiodendron maius Zn]|uniref:NADP-dependent oxidoreductase domain-containing protein n=1 Tax=Oidiodendron maius (strain Zn) TaxID=913774 RepID=A0A0C3GRY8_OIDMZ|nr:hypothetical protein OIDMADRAFT_127177 [Oidiodendron maius Zn]